MIKADLPRAPLVLALVLAPLMETSLRQSLMLSRGQPDDLRRAAALGAFSWSSLWPRSRCRHTARCAGSRARAGGFAISLNISITAE